MEGDFQRRIRNYPFVPDLGVNLPLQEVNTKQVKMRAGSSRRVHCHAWIGTYMAAVRRGRGYKAHA